MPHDTVQADGAWDFSGGVSSAVVTTVRSDLIPHGLSRDSLAWANNITIRKGVISPRPGWIKAFDLLPGGLWQGGIFYEPPTDDPPYLISSISGRIYKANITGTVTDLSAIFALTNPATIAQAFFAQGNGFLVIQAGDGVTKPLFYNSYYGDSLRRSNGLTGNLATSELPPAFAMVYYANRIWYSAGQQYTAGDIAGNSASGTLPFKFRDSILKVTENPLAFGGDGFTVPSAAGNIRALGYTANLDTTLGQGPLYIFTRRQVYSLVVPVSRSDWIAATSNNQPIQTVVQINNGAVGEDGIVHVNGDLFYQGIEPSIRSLTVATRWYGQWGNVPISNDVSRAIDLNDRSVLRRASGLSFDNRLLEGCLPKQTISGVVTPGILPLNFDLISTLKERLPPAWEGVWTGLDIIKMFSGDFGGLQRAFAVCVSRKDASLDVYELTQFSRFDSNGQDDDERIEWYAEFPAFEWGNIKELKQVLAAEVWIDRVFGEVSMLLEYRPDASACWTKWAPPVIFCSARNCKETIDTPCAYPVDFGEGYRFPITFGTPLVNCNVGNRRPSDICYQCQPKLTVKGFCRVRGIILYSAIKQKGLYEGLVSCVP